MVRINWTKQATDDLKNIYNYISIDSKFYAKRQISKLKLRTHSIKLFIKIGRVVPEFEIKEIRELIEGRYRIVYKIINSSEVDILTVHHSAREDLKVEDFS